MTTPERVYHVQTRYRRVSNDWATQSRHRSLALAKAALRRRSADHLRHLKGGDPLSWRVLDTRTGKIYLY